GDNSENNINQNNNNQSNGEVAGQDENAGQEEESKYNVTDDLGAHNFGGYIFKILAREGWRLDVEEEVGEILDDAIYRRNRNVEERFNFKFRETMIDTYEVADVSRRSILASDRSYDIMLIRGPHAFQYASEGMLRPMTELPYVDFDKPYWDEWLTGQFTIANRIFFAAGVFDIYTYGASAMLFNKPLAQNLGIEDIYTVVREGKWTFDKFAELGKMAMRDLNGSGIITPEDQHAYLGVTRGIQPSFWIAGGAKTISFDEDKLPYLSALEEKFLNVWFKMSSIMVTDGLWFHNVPDPNEHTPENHAFLDNIFKEGRSLFMSGGIGSAQHFRDMDIDFGIIPYPKYDEQQEHYYSQIAWIEPVSIPAYANDDDMDMISIILEALAAESYRRVTPVYIDVVLRTKYTRDDESEEMLDIIFANRVFDWGDAIWTPLLRDGIFPALYPRGFDTVQSRLERAERSINREIARMVNAFMDLD
ncbi:MAG: extracellular solute-binding protein, partial [Oscillospiraceae bacterium]|nr:extracellular solute-binding protein [Oscillospiraceae bacterium]